MGLRSTESRIGGQPADELRLRGRIYPGNTDPMRVGAFELDEPLPELLDPHAIVMLRPWVDVGSVGTLTLRRLERRFRAKEIGRLARPGTFFDFTRYRPMTRLVDTRRETTFPNAWVRHARAPEGSDLVFLHLLEPHAMAEDYIDSIMELLEYLKVTVYCRVGAMYDSVPHTRPIVITGNTGTLEPRPGSNPPLVMQRQSTYEGPTSIMNLVTDRANEAGIITMNFMAHLPHYAQMDEDFLATARMLQVLSAFFDIPLSDAAIRRGEEQYRHLAAAVERNSELKSVIAELEAHYDLTYGTSESRGEPSLSPEIEQFLRGLDIGTPDTDRPSD
jgi:PAC2 family